ncbi:MAG TPA: hypothetical protein PK605_00330 [Ignavibacteria bacterium]|nr:hypothetical protein [Bacteroidota bacterium]HRE10774.1 hypothetical protein [Ignavibacteria bacterium]HRF65984.1 hypothetical protein [Ignavibacteria bacterium]HRJ02825.1 hypothetical protein [Ignavibacteria bacterium]HRJ84383.1 hypothetical protein [Ignavibacteria bacterium]
MTGKDTIQELPVIRKRVNRLKKYIIKTGIKQTKVAELVNMNKQNFHKLINNKWTPKNIASILTKIENHYSLN